MRTFGFKTSSLLLAAALIALLNSCGGGGGGSTTPAPAPTSTKLSYANDATATSADWRVEVISGNNTSTLLLGVYGPTGVPIKGATVFLTCDSAHTTWSKPTGATDPYALQGSALDLTTGGSDNNVVMFKSRRSGSDLQVGAYQKTGTVTLDGTHPLFSLALNLKTGTTPGAASLTATASRTSIYLDSTGEHTLPLKLGTLSAQ